MEIIKNYEEIYERDSRHHDFVVPAEGFRKISLADIYKDAKNIILHENVPENIRSHFEMARNLLIYSWFHYPFHMAAWLYALISVEYALKETFRINNIKIKNKSFKNMLTMAVKEKWILPENFSHIQTRIRNMSELPEGFYGPIETDVFKHYCDSLCKHIPFFRNKMAHGSTMLLPGTSEDVRICSEIINQLFMKI